MNTEVPKNMRPMVSRGMKSVTQAYSVIYAIAAASRCCVLKLVIHEINV